VGVEGQHRAGDQTDDPVQRTLLVRQCDTDRGLDRKNGPGIAVSCGGDWFGRWGWRVHGTTGSWLLGSEQSGDRSSTRCASYRPKDRQKFPRVRPLTPENAPESLLFCAFPPSGGVGERLP